MDIIEYIEKITGQKLKEYQKDLVKVIVINQGKIATFPKHHGKTNRGITKQI
jgi:hypothetical protein